MQPEFEARFLNIDVSAVTQTLQDLGAYLHLERTLMRRVVFKNADITAAGGWLRLRDEGHRVTLTYKQTASVTAAIDSILETEIEVSGFDTTHRLLTAIGCRAVRYQENYRQEWRLGGIRFDLDTWPDLPTFLEVEGPDAAAVETAAGKLGLPMARATYGSVDEVYQSVLGRDILADREARLVFTDSLAFTWHETPAPAELPITQVYVFAIDPADGRVLIQDRPGKQTRYMLPGGRPEPVDGGDPLATAAREVLEESQVHIDTARAVLLGHQVVTGDPARPEPHAQLRYVAPITAYQPIGPDPDDEYGRTNRRLMTSLHRAAELLEWGEQGHQQAQAAARAARQLGIDVDHVHAEGYRDHGDTP